jgi:hypothetical protein
VIVRVLSIAEAEAADAALFYEGRRPGLGEEFLAEFEVALERIRSEPSSLARVEGYNGPHELRRCLLRRFPYIVVFRVQFDEAIAVAVADCRRKPFYWLERLH